jgi:putative transposase
MTEGLKRHQFAGDLHFVTFSCDQRRPYLASAAARCLFEDALERVRERYGLYVTGYVVMPEHVHLLLSEPREAPLSRALHSLKSSVSKRSPQRPFWLPRYYDFNVFTARKRVEKLRYIHRNPVVRGWWKGLKTGIGRAFATTLRESVEPSKLNRFGLQTCGKGRKLIRRI